MRTIVAALAFLAIAPAPVRAQVGGVYIDPQGMLREAASLDPAERLALLKSEAAEPAPGPVRVQSPLRKVSLRRLEQAVQELHAEGKPIPAEMRNLAGLVRLQHVFFYPESGDVVIAGPAEGWTQLPTGEVVGQTSKRPVLQLDDLIVALRYTFHPDPTTAFVGCSIEPTVAGLQKHAAYMKGLAMDRSRAAEIFRGMEQAMGPQAVKIYGVSGSTRLAMKLVSADYRLKRIALAHDPSPVPEVVNYLDLQAKRLTTGPQKQHRWWFIGRYDAVHHSADHTAFEFEGSGVAVETAPTVAEKAGDKPAKKAATKPAEASISARQFATSATKHFPALAQHIPIFAELQNLVALLAASELIAERSAGTESAEEDDQPAPYEPVHFLDTKACPIAAVNVPTQVASLSNYRLVDNRNWLISISGGVEVRPGDLVDPRIRKESPRRKLSEVRERNRPADEASRWWWD